MPICLPASFALKPEELKADMEAITTNVDHYSVRSAAVASDELRSGATAEAWFDRQRQALHSNSHTFERGQNVFVYMQGQRVDDSWQLTAMNAVEVSACPRLAPTQARMPTQRDPEPSGLPSCR